MAFDLEVVKEHPYAAAAIAGGVVLVFLAISHGRSGTTVAASGVDPTTASLFAAQQHDQVSLQAATLAASSAQNLAVTQADYGLKLATIQTNAATSQSNTAAAVATAQINSQADIATKGIAATLQATQDQLTVQGKQIDATLSAQHDINATTLGIATLTASEQIGIADITGRTQVALSNNQTQATIANINASKSVAQSGQSSSMWGSIIGTGASLLSSFFL